MPFLSFFLFFFSLRAIENDCDRDSGLTGIRIRLSEQVSHIYMYKIRIDIARSWKVKKRRQSKVIG